MAKEAEEKKEYDLEEISKHTTSKSCWLIIGNATNGKFVFVFGLVPDWMKMNTTPLENRTLSSFVCVRAYAFKNCPETCKPN